MKAKNKYEINQSPFYKCCSHSRLAKILGIEKKTLSNIIERGDKNYYFSTLSSGRDIQVPKFQLKRIHSRIQSLLSRISTPDYLNSGVSGRSNVKNAFDHVGYKRTAKIDIKSYYNKTSQQLVESCFRKQFSCSKDVAETISKLCCVQGHLATGSPISQIIAFYVNKNVFDKVERYSAGKNIKFTLYVDDLTFSGESVSRDFIRHVIFIIKKDRDYDLHKIRHFNPSTPKPITGAVVDGNTVKVKNSHRKIISEYLNKVNYYSKANIEDEKRERFFQILIGHLFSAGQINGRYYQMGYKMVDLRKRLNIKAVNR